MRNQIIGILFGLAVAVGILACLTPRDRARDIKLQPENSGRIQSIALQTTRDSSPYTDFCFQTFLNRIEPDVQIIAVCGTADDARDFQRSCRKWKVMHPSRIRTVVVNKPITGWCKDRFLVAKSPAGALLYPSVFEEGSPGRIADHEVAPALIHAFPRRFRKIPIPLKFDAGDLLATESKVIISDTLWNKNDRSEHFTDQLKHAFGQKLIWLHRVPDHHIGMFAAPLDEKTILVGDPWLGQRLWSEHATRSLGRPKFSPSEMTPFKHAADQLRQAGFQVVSVPTAVFDTKVYLSYTNGIFETRGSRKIVYMPWYDEPRLDQAAMQIYRSQGWEVIPIPVRSVYRFRGTIGCLVNVLERK